MFVGAPNGVVKHPGLKRQLVATLHRIGRPLRSSTQCCSLPPSTRSFARSSVRRKTDHSSADVTFDGRDIDGGNDSFAYRLKGEEQSAGHTIYRRIHPGGRIVGKPGRRQRETSETLQIKSLGKSSRVVIFRDVNERSQNRTGRSATSSSIGPNPQPSQPETDIIKDAFIGLDALSSIEQLRPSDPLLEGEALDDLRRKLDDGYNQSQLRQYLKQFTRKAFKGPETRQRETSDITISEWQPGQSSLQNRIPTKRNAHASRKEEIIDNIIKEAWSVSSYSKAQEQGELEMAMSDAQQRLLLATVEHDGHVVPRWHTMLSSALLAESIEIYPIKGTGIIRMNARKQDATQAARELAISLSSMVTLDVRLSTLALDANRGASFVSDILGQTAAREQIELATSASIAAPADGGILINAPNRSVCLNARSAIRQVFDSSTTGTQLKVLQPFGRRTPAGSAVLVPAPVSLPTVPRVAEYITCSRLVAPQSKRQQGGVSDGKSDSASALHEKMRESIEQADDATAALKGSIPLIYRAGHNDAYITHEWLANIGHVLRYNRAPELSRFVPGVPFTESLLQTLRPSQQARTSLMPQHLDGHQIKDSFVVHLTHADTLVSGPRPDVELHFNLREKSTDRLGERSTWQVLAFDRLVIRLPSHQLRVQLPSEHADLQLQQDVKLHVRSPKGTDGLVSTSERFEAMLKDLNGKSLSKAIANPTLTFNLNNIPLHLAPSITQDHEATDESGKASCVYAVCGIETRREMTFDYIAQDGLSTCLSIIESHNGRGSGRRREILVQHDGKDATKQQLVRDALSVIRAMGGRPSASWSPPSK